MSQTVCIHVYLSGKVQGVWFRASAKKEADQCGITGWARNLPDGRVEVLACGEADKIAAFEAWLKKGPPQAKVTDLVRETQPWQDYSSFEVL